VVAQSSIYTNNAYENKSLNPQNRGRNGIEPKVEAMVMLKQNLACFARRRIAEAGEACPKVEADDQLSTSLRLKIPDVSWSRKYI
jgi:hypothetical protein